MSGQVRLVAPVCVPSPKDIDYASIFASIPTPLLLLDDDLVIRDCSEAFARVVHRTRACLLGQPMFTAFPSSATPDRSDAEMVRQSLLGALATGQPAVLGTVRYDLHDPGTPGGASPRFWSVTAVPVNDMNHQTPWLLYHVHDVTALHSQLDGTADPFGGHRLLPNSAALQAAAALAEQSQLFDATMQAERQYGMTVQSLMLPSELPDAVRARGGVAVRYRPASEALRVGGDWYDVADLGDGRVAVAVGDVVGHGVVAASVMGQLRSALSALIVADVGPANAIAALYRVARTSPQASMSTAVKVVIDPTMDLLMYSSAGHPPPLLVRADGTVALLDRAQGPPLAVTPTAMPRPLGTAAVGHGDVLVLYTDGLVERRDEDLDVSIDRLGQTISGNRALDVEMLADLLLEQFAPAHALRDDVALVVLRI